MHQCTSFRCTTSEHGSFRCRIRVMIGWCVMTSILPDLILRAAPL